LLHLRYIIDPGKSNWHAMKDKIFMAEIEKMGRECAQKKYRAID
jgi:hypothetical protein